MNGEIKRGEIYWVRFGEAVGSEETVSRPAVIVSSDRGNETSPVVNAVYTTTQQKFGSVNIPITTTNRPSWVMCNQIATIDKTRLDRYMCTLSDDEMIEVNRGITIALGLYTALYDEDLVSENERLLKRMDDLEAKCREEAVARDVSEKLYETALDKLVSLKFERDMVKKSPKEPDLKLDKKEKPVVEKFDEPEELPDINTCSFDVLRGLGCSPVVAQNIISKRPYQTVEDLRLVPQLTRVAYALLEKRVCCVPIAPPVKKKTKTKVNVNTATVEEMVEIAGLSEQTAVEIRKYRNKHGKFVRVEDLLNVPRFGKICLKRYADKLEV